MNDDVLGTNLKKPIFVGLFILFILIFTLSGFSFSLTGNPDVINASENLVPPVHAIGWTM